MKYKSRDFYIRAVRHEFRVYARDREDMFHVPAVCSAYELSTEFLRLANEEEIERQVQFMVKECVAEMMKLIRKEVKKDE